jgi:hypothetical protein
MANRFGVLKGVGDYGLELKKGIVGKSYRQSVFEYYVLKAHMKFTKDTDFGYRPNIALV